jgi:hypothetical protein
MVEGLYGNMDRVENSIAVLCRGNSLHYIDEIPLVDEYIIVNRFGDELEDEKIADRLQNETISQVISIVPDEHKSMLERGHYKKFNITKLILPYIRETVPGSGPKLENRDGNIIPSYVLGDNHKQYMYKRGERPDGNTRYAYSYPTSGIAAVVHSAIDCDKENIYIIGLDFYEAKYAYGYVEDGYSEYESVEQSLRRGEDPTMMRNFLTDFLSKQIDKQFTIVTSTDYKCEFEHVEVITVK